MLESILENMSVKMFHLEKELSEVKESQSQYLCPKDKWDLKGKSHLNEKPTEKISDNPTKATNTSTELSSYTNSANDDGDPSAENKSEKDKTQEIMFHCEKGAYKSKKEVTLNKHMNTKHQYQKCKVCDLTFNTAMELLKHVAQQHDNIVDKKATTSEITTVKEPDEVIEVVEDGKFKCARCRK